MLDYKLIEALAAVINEGGFDRAAKKLHITQSAVSQRVKLIEEQAGQVLVNRMVPPKATQEGLQFLKHYNQVKSLEADLQFGRESKEEKPFQPLTVGINADSLATWFLPAVGTFLKTYHVVLDLKVDDQDETHKLLRNGEVAGCISSEKSPVQGCTVEYIGAMNYRLLATPDFISRYFTHGLNESGVRSAPAVIFNRKDDIHHLLIKRLFQKDIKEIPIQYVPSSEKFVQFIVDGLGYGMVPDLQGLEFLNSGDLVELAVKEHIKVDLYWHRWNLKSRLLDAFSAAIVKQAVIC
ncbi:MAG: LysR family transcriptional regulator ArgP [Desulfobacteraceae bacterium]|nr:LysR family transcriptional regulator ArgP [Desulfobacteraceae bacterium]